jgi:hypothetical protein
VIDPGLAESTDDLGALLWRSAALAWTSRSISETLVIQNDQ